jgi:hypothetical protein
MTEQIFEKELTANDVGETGGHQAGMHIPKKQKELVEFLPGLDPKIKNPDTWLHCKDADGNEYRITHMTPYFRAVGARSGDNFRVSGVVGENAFRISVVTSALKKEAPQDQKTRIKLRGWRRVH